MKMLFRSMAFVMVAATLALIGGEMVLAQQGGEGRGEGRRGGFDAGQMRERMLGAMQQELEATDEEWQVIKPRLEKVMELQFTARMGGMRLGRGFGGPGGPGGPGAPGAPGEGGRRGGFNFGSSPEADALQAVLDSPDSTNEQIQSAMKAVRDARTKREQELKQAQQELQEVLSLRQEARLVLSRMLD